MNCYILRCDPYCPQMVYATQDNKQKCIAWLKQQFNGSQQGNRRGYSGSTPSEAIRLAVELGCDTMFVLTDDPPYLKLGNVETGVEITDHQEQIKTFIRGIEATTGHPIKINPLIYKPHENERGKQGIEFYKDVARTTGGRVKIIKN